MHPKTCLASTFCSVSLFWIPTLPTCVQKQIEQKSRGHHTPHTTGEKVVSQSSSHYAMFDSEEKLFLRIICLFYIVCDTSQFQLSNGTRSSIQASEKKKNRKLHILERKGERRKKYIILIEARGSNPFPSTSITRLPFKKIKNLNFFELSFKLHTFYLTLQAAFRLDNNLPTTEQRKE